MSGKIKAGIIGLGFMGSTHFNIYGKHEHAEVTAIADVDPAKRKGDISAVVANIDGGDNKSKPLDLSGIRVYEDGLALIRDPDVDLVDICLPVYLHKDFALAAIEAGKPFLCEKPLARTSTEAQAIAGAAQKAGISCLVGMCIRFWPEYRHALEYIRSGKAGRIRRASFKRISPDVDGNSWQNWFMKADLSGGAILDLHLHDVDFLCQLMGMPKAVTSFGLSGLRSDHGIDHVMTRYDYGDDTLVTAEGGWSPPKGTPFEMSFQILCERMTFHFSVDGYCVIHEDGTVERPKPGAPSRPTGWHVEIDYLIRCLREKSAPDMPLDEVADSIRIIEAEARSIRTGKTITL